MKKSFKMAVALLLALVMGSSTAFAAGLTDINDHWAKDYIQNFVDKGLISGYEDGSFKPDNQIKRGEFIYIVNKAYGFNDTISPAAISFKDVPADAWYYRYIAIAVAAKYISGYDDNTMRPENPISREEAAVVITKLNSLTPDASKSVGFKDSEKFEDWSKPYIGAVAEATFMKGDDLGYFNPAKNLTRAEAVVLLTKSSEAYKPSEPTVPSDTAIKIDLPVTTDVAINSTNTIIRFNTTPSDVTITAKTDNDLLTVDAFSTKMTINTGSKAGVTRVTLTMSKEGYATTEYVIDINVVDAASEKALKSDAKSLTEDSLSLFYKDESLDKVTGNINLPTTGEKGSTIKWSSSNTEIISIKDGKATVTQPYYSNGKDTTVTLTATLENNGYTETKQFYVTVLRAESSDDVSVTSEVYSVASSGANTVISSARQAVTESLSVKNFLSNLKYHPYADVKVVSESVGKGATSVSKFDSADSKSSASSLKSGDYLIIKSENGEKVRSYLIKTMLQCSEVSNFKWNGNGELTWTKPSTTYGYYVEVYKNEDLVLEEEVKANTTTLNVLDTLKAKGVGSYTAKIINKGDMNKYANSDGAETSTSQKISQLAIPDDLKWSGSSAVWSGDSRAKSYSVTFYKDSVVAKTLNSDTTRLDLSEYLQATGDFKFRVTAVADPSSLYIDSDISDQSAVISR